MGLSKPWAHIPPSGPLLRAKAAAAYIGYSKAQFYALVNEGILPAPIHLGDNCHAAGVSKPWLDAVIASRAAATREVQK